MSVQQISKALALRGVSQAEKLLLIVLANYADEDGRCWPSQKRLASDTGMTDRGIRKLLAAMDTGGIISRETRNRRDGSRGTDVITLHLDRDYQRNAVPAEQNASDAGSPEPDDTITGTSVHVLPEPRSGLTTFEPTIEPSIEPSPKRTGLFDRFWSAYPKKVGKRAAEKAWLAAVKREGFGGETIINGVNDALNRNPEWRRGYIAHPSKWLNGDHWTDEHDDRPTASANFSAKGVQRYDNFRRAFAGAASFADTRDDDL